VYLEEGEYEEGKPEYATLTYCWGKDKFLNTTRKTISSHKAGIRIVRLPRILYDAVKVAGWPGIWYLWIDALCVLQDSESDWAQECGRMAEYYSNSVVTISAMESTAANEGFLIPRSPSMIAPLRPKAAGNL
jgi:hypothetical protein